MPCSLSHAMHAEFQHSQSVDDTLLPLPLSCNCSDPVDDVNLASKVCMSHSPAKDEAPGIFVGRFVNQGVFPVHICHYFSDIQHSPLGRQRLPATCARLQEMRLLRVHHALRHPEPAACPPLMFLFHDDPSPTCNTHCTAGRVCTQLLLTCRGPGCCMFYYAFQQP